MAGILEKYGLHGRNQSTGNNQSQAQETATGGILQKYGLDAPKQEQQSEDSPQVLSAPAQPRVSAAPRIPAPPQITREPANTPEQEKPWGLMDNLGVAAKSLNMGMVGQALPVGRHAVTSPLEAAPRPNMLAHKLGIPESVGNFIQAVPGIAADIGEVVGGSLVGGPVGAGVAAGGTTIGRNAEQNRIEMERARDAQAAAEGTLTPFTEQRGGELLQSYGELDAGDAGEAVVNALTTGVMTKFGQMMDAKTLGAILAGARPVLAQATNVAKQVGADAVTALPAAVVARANAADMTAADWLDPEKVAQVLNPRDLLQEVGQQVVFSAAGQIPGAIATTRQATPFRPDSDAQASAEAEFQEDARAYDRRAEANRLINRQYDQRAIVNDLDREYDADINAEYDARVQRGIKAREMLEAEQREMELTQARAAVQEARRRVVDNPGDPSAHDAVVAAIDRVKALESPEKPETLALPSPKEETYTNTPPVSALEPDATIDVGDTKRRMDRARAARQERKEMLGYVPPMEPIKQPERIAPEQSADPAAPELPGNPVQPTGPSALYRPDLTPQSADAPQSVSPPARSATVPADAAGSPPVAQTGAAGETRLPGPYGDANPNPIWGQVERPPQTQVMPERANVVDGQERPPNTPEQQAEVDRIEAVGADARNEEGELPRRVYGTNLRTITGGGDEAKKNFVAGAMLLDEEKIQLERQVEEGLFERAAKVTEYDNINAVRNVKADGGYSDAQAVALMDRARGKLEKARNEFSPENLTETQEYLAANGRMGSAQGRALGARNLAAEAMENQMTPLEYAIFNTQKMFTSSGIDKIPEKALSRLLKVKDPNDRLEITEALFDIAKTHRGLWGKISSFRYANMLSSPNTHRLNFSSGGFNVILKPLSHAGGRLLDAALPGKSEMARGETRAMVGGFRTGINEGLSRALFVLNHGFRKGDMRELDPNSFLGELPWGKKNPFNYPSRLLSAVDEMYRGTVETGYRQMYAHRKAYFEGVDQGLRGKELDAYVTGKAKDYAIFDRAIEKQAREDAAQIVFQEPNFIPRPKFGSKKVPALASVGNAGLDVLVPFFKTIMNWAKASAIYAGGGVVTSIAGRKSFKGTMTRAERMEDLAKGLIGITGTLALYMSTDEDSITADVPDDPKERELFYEAGKKPFSINIGGRWVPYNYFGPLMFNFMAVAQAHQTKSEEFETNQEAVIDWATGMLRIFKDLPVVSGIGGAIDAINNPSGVGQSFAANLISQVVPFSSAQRYGNATGLSGNTAVPDAKTIGERVQGGTVLADGEFLGMDIMDPLPQKLNSFGIGIDRNGYMPEVDQGDPVYAELERLGINPPSTPTGISVKGKMHKLTPEERREILAAGRPAYNEVLERSNEQWFKELPKDRQKQNLKSYMDKRIEVHRNKARNKIRNSLIEQSR